MSTQTSPSRRAGAVRTGVRPEIQALRAVAVMLVVVYHLWPSALPGGFVGVDVFFAISGFLITGLLLREAEKRGTVSIPGFWARRVRRILPASLVTLLFCALATLILVPLEYWEKFFSDIRASTLYVQNWHLAHSAVDYFAADDAVSPVQHFWSLSVEEQFYLVWPLLIALAARARDRRRAIAGVMALVTVLSLAFSLYYTAANQAAAYFVTVDRAWEFGAGALLALLPDLRGSPVARSALAWAGLAAIALAAALYSDGTPFPGSAATLPVFGAVAIMRAGMPPLPWGPGRLYALRPVQLVGDISYSVYLWHWPLIVLAPIVLGRDLNTPIRICLLVLTLLLAWLSKVVIEDPLRRRRGDRRTFAFAALGTGVVLAVTAAGFGHLHAQVRKERAASRRVVAAAPKCFGAAARDPRHPCRNPELRLSVVPTPIEAQTQPNAPCRVVFYVEGKDVCEFGDPHAPETVALIGDSHAGVYRIPLDAVARAHHWRGLRFGHSSCPLSAAPRDLPGPERAHCTRWRDAVVQWLSAHPDVHTVFVSQLAAGRGVVTRHGQDQFATATQGYLDGWARLPASVTRIMVIRDNPSVDLDTNACVEQAMTKRKPAGPACALPRREALDPDPAAEAARRAGGRVSLLDLTPFFCDRRLCYPVIGGVLVYKDTTHLTGLYAKTLGPYLLRAVDGALRP